tara:strand:+ start:405 stop:635 length:231 start_codon:yes stop_codon:yes gene_type:complete
MFVLRREDKSLPFAVIADLDKLELAIKEELSAESVELHDDPSWLDWGESTDISTTIVDEEGDEYEWTIEVTKVTSY